MKIVIATDSFKGSLSSRDAGEAIREGVLRALPTAQTAVVPIADGGEGTVEALTDAMGGRPVTARVSDPLGRPINATYGLIEKTGTAVIEMSAAAGITLRAQIVLCRGINDGAELVRSMNDLARLYPALDSVSVVPAGLTAHREGLYPLTAYSSEEAAGVIRTVEEFASAHYARTGSRLIFAADELYLRAGLPIPSEEAYEGYPQIENGVGMLRSLREEALAYLEEAEVRERPARQITLATGVAAAPLLREIVDIVSAKDKNLSSKVYEIKNRWFGESITVAGLLTGHDIAEQLEGEPLGDLLLLPRSTLRAEGDLFLCGMSPDELSRRLAVPIVFIGEDGAELAAALLGDS